MSPHPGGGVGADTWRDPIRKGLAALPEARRRALRGFAAGSGAGGSRLQPGAGGPALLDLAGNDYLGLARHPAVRAAAAASLARDGLGAGASRLVSGSRPVHARLEQDLARWLGRERVLLF
ncbi:MAG: hypothetical protein VKI81_01025, partial [Synechococcaceae cyanobacterium]|nr:hypothetical protein [Synechococcaceae cyanobacterium]